MVVLSEWYGMVKLSIVHGRSCCSFCHGRGMVMKSPDDVYLPVTKSAQLAALRSEAIPVTSSLGLRHELANLGLQRQCKLFHHLLHV